MEIRRASQDDARILSSLNVDVQHKHAEAMPRLFKFPLQREFALDFMRQQLSQPDNYFFIARLDGEDIGYVFARLIERPENPFMKAWRTLLIDQISVAPAHQKKGCGRLLMEHIGNLAREKGVNFVILDTWAFNLGAQAFFSRVGFETFTLRMWREEAPE